MWVPSFRNNLMSVSSITDNGYSVTFHKEHAVVKRKDGSIALTAKRQDGLYVVKPQGSYAYSGSRKQNYEVASKARIP